jgi:chromosome segregation ATPase
MAIICCATPFDLEDTRLTLQFASSAKLVKTRAQVNEISDNKSRIEKLQRELKEANATIAALREVASFTKSHLSAKLDDLPNTESELNEGVISLKGDLASERSTAKEPGRLSKIVIERLLQLTSELECILEADKQDNNVKRERMEARIARLKMARVEVTASSSNSHDRILEDYNAVNAELASARSEIDDVNRRIERLTAENDAARDDNNVKREQISVLKSENSSHIGTITRQQTSIAHLKGEVRSITLKLSDAKREMEGMQSPRPRDALEQEFRKKVGELEEKLTAVEGKRADMRNKLREKDEVYLAGRSELNAIKVERDELNARLSDTSSAVEEAKAKAADQELKVQYLSEEVCTAHAKIKADEGMLKEMAEEFKVTYVKVTAAQVRTESLYFLFFIFFSSH